MALSDAWGYDGRTYEGKEMRELVATLTGGAEGVTGDDDALEVSQQTVAASTVKAAAGGAVIVATASGEGGSYQVYNDADLTSPVISPTAGNGRKDRLILRVTAGVPALEIVQGVASGSPAAPSITGDNYLELALITLPASTTNITDAMITDRRVSIQPAIASTAWTSYTPTLAGWSIGNAVMSAAYMKVGRLVTYRFRFVAGTTSTFGAGGLVVSVPFAAAADVWGMHGILLDASTGVYAPAVTRVHSGSTGVALAPLSTVTQMNNAGAYGSIPWVWTTSDMVEFLVTYEATA